MAENRKFIGKLDVRMLRHKGADRKMKLLSNFSYRDKDGKLWLAPVGSIVDGASIPRAFWWIIGSPFVGDYRSATVIHDVYCQKKTRPSKRVHEVFGEMLKDLGLGWMKRTAMIKAVKWFGPKFKGRLKQKK